MTLSLTWQLSLYDRLINLPSNDWEIYYWVTGAKDTPKEFDHEVMDLLKLHAKNTEREERFHLPDLKWKYKKVIEFWQYKFLKYASKLALYFV